MNSSTSTTISLPAVVIVFILLIVRCAAETHLRTITTYPIPKNDLRGHCAFSLNGYAYDLCRLVGSTRRATVRGVPEIVLKDSDGTRGEESNLGPGDYLLTLGGAADGDEIDASRHIITPCDDETWVCVSYKARTRASNKATASITLPVVRKNSDSRISISLDNEADPPRLRLTLANNNAKQSPSSTESAVVVGVVGVEFSCGQVDKLDLVRSVDGCLQFLWSTPHGCPTNPPSDGSGHPFGMLQERQPNSDGDHNKQDDELQPTESRRARGWIGVVIVVSVLSLTCVSVLASSPRARHSVVEHVQSTTYALLSFFAEVLIRLKPNTSLTWNTTFRFRQSDQCLARWAEEDIIALDLADDDLMVNSLGSMDRYYMEEVGWDSGLNSEYIPLTTNDSPKYLHAKGGTRLPSYGATTTSTFDMEDDHDITVVNGQALSVMTGISRFFKKSSRNTRAN